MFAVNAAGDTLAHPTFDVPDYAADPDAWGHPGGVEHAIVYKDQDPEVMELG